MKKMLLSIILFMMFIPFSVNAKEYCSVVSGNGKDIGSEIACGSEHFYIIDNDGNNIKMLSKYNLYVGGIFDKKTFDINETYIKKECNNYGCTDYQYYYKNVLLNNSNEFHSKIKEELNLDNLSWDLYEDIITKRRDGIRQEVCGDKYIENDKTYQNCTYKLYIYENITKSTEGYALQNSLAKGVTGNKGNANYPIYSTFNMFYWGPNTGVAMPLSFYVNSLDNFEDGYTNFELNDDTNTKIFLEDYHTKLNDMGYSISKVDMISIKELSNMVYSITKKNLPLSIWYDESESTTFDEATESHVLGDLKEYLSDEYSWVWTTSYLTKTLVGNIVDLSVGMEEYMPYFVASSGEICYSRSDCSSGIPRAGVRPVVTISSDNIKYLIRTKTDGNGTIEVIEYAAGGDSIKFKVLAKKGLKLAGLTITTDSGEVVEFSEEDLTTNSDGTISISTNKFTMPYENVTIEARWSSSIINPNTGTGISLIIITIIIISSTIYMLLKRTKNYNLK